MAELSFNVSARTARLIGLENFANSEGAIIELVKNSYDADALIVLIIFDNISDDPKQHSITLIDNGSGMTSKIIEDNWMLIGTNNKESSAESGKGRVRSGAKGIGRFALDKLGAKTEMWTLARGKTTGHKWQVNWDDFLNPSIVLSDVKATIDDLNNFSFKAEALKMGNSNQRISKLMGDYDFDGGTIITINNLRDSWQPDDLDRLFSNLELLIPPKEQGDFKISLFSTNNPNNYGDVPTAFYDDFDYKLTATTQKDNDKLINIVIERNDLDPDQLLVKYPELFSDPLIKKAGLNISHFKKSPSRYQIQLSELVKGFSEVENGEEIMKKIGAFQFTCYFLKNTVGDDSDSGKYPYKPINGANRKAWLKKFGGLKIFRDGFRVRPYGEFGQDWLLLGDRYAQNPAGAGQKIGTYKIRPNQISGAINISRLTNLSFQDKSGREGIQENEVFDLFKEIIKGLIAQIERDRNIIMYSISQLYKKKNKEAEAKRKAEELAEQALKVENAELELGNNVEPHVENETDFSQIEDEGETDPPTTSDQRVLDLAKGFVVQAAEIREKDDEIRLLRGLAGVGLIISSFAHELRNIRPLLVTRTESLINILKGKVDPTAFVNLKEHENPIRILTIARDQELLIKHWLEYSLSALKKDKRTRTDIDLIDYFHGFDSKWKPVLDKRFVEFSLIKPKDIRPRIRGFVIDLDTIFNNMLSNALESFRKIKTRVNKQIKIELSVRGNDVHITFDDNGSGLSKDFTNPEDIFLPFETSKKGGTGLGMYLAKSIVEEYEGTINILRTSPGFKLSIIIPIKNKK